MKFPRVTLRVKLAFVSLLLFAIPLIGFWYASNMQAFLLEAQEQALSLTARAVTTIFNDRPELFERNILQSVDATKEIHAYSLPNKINLDGFSEDWGGLLNEAVFYGEENILEGVGGYHPDLFSFKHICGVYDNYIYALFIVRDDIVVHRKIDSLHVDRSDHLQIGIESSGGKLNRYLLSPIEPGWVTAHLMPDDTNNFVAVKNETRIQGFWSDTFDGYILELRIPTDLIKNKIAFAIGDVDDSQAGKIKTVIGTSSTKRVEDLENLLSRSLEIERILTNLERPATKIWIVDRRKRVRARVGSLEGDTYQFVPENNNLGGQFLNKILRPVYDFFSEKLPGEFVEDHSYLSEYDLEDIDTALSGKSFTARRKINGTDAEIIMAAEPLWGGKEIQGAVVVEQTTNNILAEKKRIIEDTISITVLVFFIGAIFLFTFASRLSGRIRRLSNQADKAIGKDGRINNTITPLKAGDEIGDLSRNLSAMVKRLHGFHKYQEKMADNLEHELRTPLAGVSASLTNMRQQLEGGDQNVNEYLMGAQNNLKRMENILTKIRDATILEEALRQDEQEKFDLAAALNAWVTRGYKQAFSAREFVLDVPNNQLPILADPNRIYQMLDKLVENAVDFSPEGSRIIITLARTRKEVALSVVNEGPMLDPEIMDQIFDSMVSLRGSQKHSGHLGLGLYVVREIAEFHRGNVVVQNRDDGISGVVFTVNFPLHH